MDDKRKTNKLKIINNKDKVLLQNDLGKVTISNKIKNLTSDNIINKKKTLDEELKKAIATYNQEYNILNDRGIELFYLRKRSLDLIEQVEFLVNSIANHPKEFDKEIADINLIKDNFKEICDFTKEELETTQKSAITAGVGVTSGLAICNLAPSAAMWVATTFGTASTGTAISTLSGAAATKAALAWLGGGAISAGGSGVAGGSALLALAGPVGWSIAGATLLTSIVLLKWNKGKIEKEKKEEIKKIKNNTLKVSKISKEIKLICEENIALFNSIKNNYQKGLFIFNNDYTLISDENRFLLGTIVNETKAIAKSIEKGIDGNGK